ncbi:Putative deoxyribonuclease YcfH [Arcticibacter svalbardensis MN12-7]|uniref:Putative deoxyribonuclease YcfH n=1 Tax=Arcticibacter svalbardensis MN12-7 TaxID=1150600 RepID=R9GLL0_9SPHI|nr:TatD family hydrolase [Arcticibacter svalbardensis]EOR92598.1 Putative deoxyribonuclease YcfH [Arcticibacter svalbardensis MN12-7]
MTFTDTHTHLYYETDTENRKLLMERCFSNDVTRLFLPNVDLETVPLVIALTNAYPENCFPMLGLHPCDVKDDYIKELQAIQNVNLPSIVAIGEIGIDLHWDKTTLASQQDAFIKQIRWAKELDLPIVIHCREAFNEVYEILVAEKNLKLRGIFHCFSGTLEQAQRIIALGFYLGIGGVVTYKNAGLDKILVDIDIENIVLETDSPYLTPVPYRGKPNESSYLPYIAARVAVIKNLRIDEVADLTTKNSKLIFGV